MRTIPKESYLKVAQLFTWATKEHYQIWFTGKTDRHRRTEVMLPRLVRKGKLVIDKVGKKIVYASLRQASKKHLFIEHGLACTEGLIRFIRSKDGEVIPERFFRGLGAVPEWGIRYPDGKLLLYEHCTQDNYEHTNTFKSKLAHYRANLEKIEEKFDGEAVVLFVIDISRERLKNFIDRQNPFLERFFFFVDYESFLKVPLGEQLTKPIYFWGGDGNPYPLEEAYVEPS